MIVYSFEEMLKNIGCKMCLVRIKFFCTNVEEVDLIRAFDY